MKTDFVTVKTNNPTEDAWRRLKRYHNEELAVRQIQSGLSIDERSKYDRDIRKQANQVSYAIRQAEEYFIAATNVSLATKPVLLYYGIVSLGRAISLLRLNGEYSFDYLRKTARHNHHGLEFRKDLNAKCVKRATLEELLSRIRCSAFVNQQKEPWGQFAIIWKASTPDAVVVPLDLDIAVAETSNKMSVHRVFPSFNTIDYQTLSSLDLSCMRLFSQIPEMVDVMNDLGLLTNLRQANVNFSEVRRIGIKVDGKVHEQISEIKCGFWVYDVSDADYTALSKLASDKNPEMVISQPYPKMAQGYYEHQKRHDEDSTVWLPDMVQAINGRPYLLTTDAIRMPLFCIHYAILFMFSMIARYYPDVWVPWVSMSPGVAEFLDFYLSSATQVLPWLTTNEIKGRIIIYN